MKANRPPILLLSRPAGGKTSGLRNIKPDLAKRTLYVNCDAKALPWVGNAAFTMFHAQCPTQLPSIIRQARNSGNFDLIVLDTITIAMSEFTRRFINTTMPKWATDANGNIVSDSNYVAVSEKNGGKIDSMGGWGRYAALVSDIVAEANLSDAQVVIMGHLDIRQDEAGDFLFKCPLQGQVGKQGLEGLFSIVMHAGSVKLDHLANDYGQDHQWLSMEESIEFTGEQFTYQVAHTKETVSTHVLRTIDGLWPKGVRFINNDLQMVMDRFDEVYGS